MTASPAGAHPDVYSALPPDAAVVQYALGDLAGDPAEELAVFFTSAGEARLALFNARAGRWVLLVEGAAPRLVLEAGHPRSLELADANGDGRVEIMTHSLSRRRGSMITRVTALDGAEGGPQSFRVLLEDETFPPGYPLLGTEKGLPGITFLRMPSPESGAGHRRVYCWAEGRFEKCLEVIWKER